MPTTSPANMSAAGQPITRVRFHIRLDPTAAITRARPRQAQLTAHSPLQTWTPCWTTVTIGAARRAECHRLWALRSRRRRLRPRARLPPLSRRPPPLPLAACTRASPWPLLPRTLRTYLDRLQQWPRRQQPALILIWLCSAVWPQPIMLISWHN